jgi:hypothetical protein
LTLLSLPGLRPGICASAEYYSNIRKNQLLISPIPRVFEGFARQFGQIAQLTESPGAAAAFFLETLANNC